MALTTETGAQQVLTSAQSAGGSIVVPDAAMLFTGDYSRSGQDLLLTGPDGAKLVLEGYFDTDTPASLVSPQGAMLTGDVVTSLAGPQFPGQYAQAGGAPAGKEAIGEVQLVEGSASVIRANGVTEILKEGDAVFQGDVVITGPGSKLGIGFIDGSVFSIAADARMVLNSLIYDPDGANNSMLFSLVEGAFVFAAGQIAPTGDMKIQTPVAVMGIRGTSGGASIDLNIGTVKFSLIRDSSGEVGKYVLLRDGIVVGNVTRTGDNWLVNPSTNEVETSPKTLAELKDDVSAVAQLNAVLTSWESSPNNPINTDGGGETKPDGDPGAGPDGNQPANNTQPSGGLNNANAATEAAEAAAAAAAAEAAAAAIAAADAAAQAAADAASQTETTVVVNQAPETFAASGAGAINAASITVALSGSDADGTVASFKILSLPSDGTLFSDAALTSQISAGGTVAATGNDANVFFVPDTGFEGAPTFTYAATDNDGLEDASPATATITVDNEAPTITLPAALPAVDEDSPDNAILDGITGNPVLIADTDGDDQTVTLIATSTVSLASTAIAALNFTTGDGTDDEIMTFTGTLAEINLALAGLTYTPTPDQDTGGSILFIANDGTAATVSTLIININPFNDAPVAGAGGVLNYTENDAASVIDATITVADVDDTNIDSATVQITGNYVQGEDILGFTDQNGITGSFDDVAGTLTLSGSATLVNYQAALRSVVYNNSSEDPSELNRTVTFTVNDGDDNSLAATSTVTVEAVNDVPVIGGVSTAEVSEDVDAEEDVLTVDDSLTIADPDTGESSFAAQASTAGDNGFGTFTLAANGVWTYTADNAQAAIDELGDGDSLTDSFTAVSLDGTASQLVTVTINGTNDAPVAVADTDSITEAAVPDTVDGNVLTNDTDVDNIVPGDLNVTEVEGQVIAPSGQLGDEVQIAGMYGSLTLNADGNYSYRLDNNNLMVLMLAAGVMALVDVFNVTISDGALADTSTLTITIDGVGQTLTGDVGPNTLTGGPENDFIDGQGGGDTLLGLGGDDFLLGGLGDDFIQGGAGNDTADGGFGEDTIFGGLGNDNIHGGEDDDFIHGGAGDDVLEGDSGMGDDIVVGGAGNDTINGGAGIDLLLGGQGNDVIDGGTGTDLLRGNEGNDQLFGGDGTDLLISGIGFDRLNGGAGNDILVGRNTVVDRTNDFDIAVYNDAANAISATLTGPLNSFTSTVTSLAGGDAANIGTDILINIDNVRGSAFADILIVDATYQGMYGAYTGGAGGGDNKFNEIRGGGGDDMITGNGFTRLNYQDADGSVTVDFGAGTGMSSGGAGGATNIGMDSFTGVNDIRGSDFADTLTGSSQATGESFRAMAGDDVIDGLGGGADRADYRNSPNSILADLSAGAIGAGFVDDGFVDAANTHGTGLFRDTLTNIENIRGSEHNDTITGDAGVNFLDGRGGDDTIHGGGGADTLRGRDGDDTLHGDGGNDTLRGDDGNDILIGGAGDDTLIGGNDFNIFRGGAGNDTLIGGTRGISGTTGVPFTDFNLADYRGATGAISVTLTGALGTGLSSVTGDASVGMDTLVDIEAVSGSAFNDTFMVDASFAGQFGSFNAIRPGDGDDTITGNGSTRIDYNDALDGVRVDLGAGEAFSPDPGDPTMADPLDAAGIGFDTFSGVNATQGSEFADTLLGADGAGFESFRGRGGDDFIDGGVGGADRADYRNSPNGILADLSGGAIGSGFVDDGFVDAANTHGTGFFRDTLTNIERIRGSEFDDTITMDDGANRVDARHGNDIVHGLGGNDDLRGDDGNDMLYGGDGADTLRAGSGFDHLFGGAGDDQLIGGDAAVPGVQTDFDFADYSDVNNLAEVGIAVNLTGAFGTSDSRVTSLDGTVADTANVGEDTLQQIDVIVGTDYADTFTVHDGTVQSAYTTRFGTFNEIEGGGGDDIISGNGATRASYRNADAAVTVDLQAGTATSTAASDAANIGNDTLSGINNLRGSDFNDTLTGRDGAGDSIRGQAGDDTIDGGIGGGDQADYRNSPTGIFADLSGGAMGAGFVQDGFGGTDTLTGIERIRGSEFGDIIILDEGDNRGRGRDGDDVISGEGGNDDLRGGAGNDLIDGGEGNDILDGGFGDDTLLGGDGNDTFIGAANVTVPETFLLSGPGETSGLGDDVLIGDDGVDSVDYGATTDGINVNLAISSTNVLGGISTVGIASGSQIGLDTLIEIENVFGGSGNDTIIGNAAVNNFTGNGGDDTLMGGAGNDVLTGGTGTDALYGGAGNDTIFIGNDDGTDSIIDGGTGVDLLNLLGISGVAGDPSLHRPSVNLTTGILTIDGVAITLAGIENIHASTQDGQVHTLSDTDNVFTFSSGSVDVDARGGVDTYIDLSAVNVDLAAGTSLSFGGSNNIITNFENAIGGIQVNNFSGSSADNMFEGGGGGDTLNGQGGTNTLSYKTSDAAVTVNLSTNSASGGHATGDIISNFHNLIGSVHDDTLTGTAGDNVIEGMGGNDTLNGLGGNDTLTGGAGDDVVDGGAGDDTIVAGEGAGNDTYDGGADTDSITFVSTTMGVTVDLVAGTASGAEIGSDTLMNIENVTGGSGNDTITGNAGDNVLEGGIGVNRLTGGAGDDTLTGGTRGANIEANFAIYSDASDQLLGSESVSSVDTASDEVTFAVPHGLVTGERVTYTESGGTIGGLVSGMVFFAIVIDAATISLASTQANAVAGTAIDLTSAGGGTFDTSNGIRVDLTGPLGTASTVQGGTSIGTDMLINIDIVTGTDFDDVFTVDNTFRSQYNGGTDPFVQINPGAGDDIIQGNGATRLRYQEITGFTADGGDGIIDGVTVNLATGQAFATNAADSALIGLDIFTGVASATGTDFADIFVGRDGAGDSFRPRGGEDFVDGGSGGGDRLDYRNSPAGVVVNMDVDMDGVTNDAASSDGDGVAQDGFGDTDTFTGIENLRGSEFGDTLTGDAGNNRFQGRDGDDALIGGGGDDVFRGGAGSDTIDGGAGSDRAEYQADRFTGDIDGFQPQLGITANLATGIVIDSYGDTDTLTGIEDIRGTDFNDVIIGDAGDNVLDGRTGDNLLRGGAGDDTLIGDGFRGLGSDFNRVDYRDALDRITIELRDGVDSTTSQAFSTPGFTANIGTDTLVNAEFAFGSDFDDTVTIEASFSQRFGTFFEFEGGDGDDTFTATGSGRVGFATALDGVTVDLQAGTAFSTTTLTGNIAFAADADVIAATGVLSISVNGGAAQTIDLDMITQTIAGLSAALAGLTNVDGSINGSNFVEITGLKDTISITISAGGSVGLIDGTVDGDSAGIGNDIFSGVRSVRGSDFDDTLLGRDEFSGSDQFRPRGGDDFIDGRGGFDDEIRYSGASESVVLDLGTDNRTISVMTISDGFGGTDTLIGIANIRSGSGDDQLTGDVNDNRLRGGDGDDILVGGDGSDRLLPGSGNDILDGGVDVGGGDFDSAQYSSGINATSGITYTGGLGVGVNGIAVGDAVVTGDESIGTDTLTRIENVRGTGFTDVFIGGDAVENFDGLDGDDIFDGGEGGDQFKPGAGNDTIDGGIDVGGGDFDLVQYAFGINATGGITYTGGLGVGVNGIAVGDAVVTGDASIGTDNFTRIEGFDGTNFGDTFNGGDADESFGGLGGDDIIDGGAGSDFLTGGDDNDDLTGGLGFDTLTGDGGADTFILETIDFADVITDYDFGQGDDIDLTALFDVISGGAPAVNDPNQFVQLALMVGGDTEVRVDQNGGADSFVHVGTLQGFGFVGADVSVTFTEDGAPTTETLSVV